MTFATELSAAVRNTTKALNTAYKKSLITTFRLVIQQTPRKDGYAQGGWVLANGEVLDGQSPNRTNADLNQLLGLPDIGGVVTLYNNIPYIERLETGWSQQAPAGMVRININRFPALLQANYR